MVRENSVVPSSRESEALSNDYPRLVARARSLCSLTCLRRHRIATELAPCSRSLAVLAHGNAGVRRAGGRRSRPPITWSFERPEVPRGERKTPEASFEPRLRCHALGPFQSRPPHGCSVRRLHNLTPPAEADDGWTAIERPTTRQNVFSRPPIGSQSRTGSGPSTSPTDRGRPSPSAIVTARLGTIASHPDCAHSRAVTGRLRNGEDTT